LVADLKCDGKHSSDDLLDAVSAYCKSAR